MFNPLEIANKIVARIKESNPELFKQKYLLGRLTVIAEEEIRKAYLQHGEENKTTDEF